MTMHYSENIDEITPELILTGWEYHGNKMPEAFGVFTEGDSLAFNCWCYLAVENRPTVEEFCKDAPADKREKIIKIMKEVIKIAISKKLIKT